MLTVSRAQTIGDSREAPRWLASDRPYHRVLPRRWDARSDARRGLGIRLATELAESDRLRVWGWRPLFLGCVGRDRRRSGWGDTRRFRCNFPYPPVVPGFDCPFCGTRNHIDAVECPACG